MTRRAWIAWVAVCLIWGTTYLAIKIALETIPPFLMGGLRYVAAGLGLAAIIVIRGRALPAISTWPRLAVLGFFMIAFGNGGVVLGSQWLPSGLTAVLIATSPFWMVSVEAAVSGGKQLHLRQWAGLTVGFLGILVLVWPELSSGGETMRGMLWGVLAVQMACAGWAVGSAYTRRHVMPSDVIGAAALQMLFGGIFMLIAGTLHDEWVRLAFSPRTTGRLLISTLQVHHCVRRLLYASGTWTSRSFRSTPNINPVIAVALGAVVLGESLGWRTLAAAGPIALA